ncbi:unnamed protein product [Brassica oleracea var. botrytis]
MDLEELTMNAKQIQEDMLEEILKVNANTEYLRRFLHGSSDKELFKKNVPVVTYEDVRPYIERVKTDLATNIVRYYNIRRYENSSLTGTTGGKQKIFPANNKYFEKTIQRDALLFSIFLISLFMVYRHINGIEDGKKISFLNTRPLSKTPSGLPLITSFIMSDCFKNWSSRRNTSPDEVILCADSKQNMYCHLICALVQREDVVRMYAPFASVLVQAIKFLETHWKELCNNIRNGYISEWITDFNCRESVSDILGGPNFFFFFFDNSGPNLDLADLIERECCHRSWEVSSHGYGLTSNLFKA